MGLAVTFILLGSSTESFGLSAASVPDNCDALFPNQGYVNSPSGGCVKGHHASPVEKIEDRLENKVIAEKKNYERAQALVDKECSTSETSFFNFRFPGSEDCKRAKEDRAVAWARLEDTKLDSIRLVRSMERAAEGYRRAQSFCSSPFAHQKDKVDCQMIREKFPEAQKTQEKITAKMKEEIYGCKTWRQTPLECVNVTYDGAKLSLSDWQRDVFGPKPEKKEGLHNQIEAAKPQQIALKDKIHAAKQDALDGKLKDCHKVAGGGFSCLNSQGQRYPVDYTAYKGWELAQGKTIPSKPERDPGQLVPKAEPKKEKKTIVEGITQEVRDGFELANRLKNDLRNTEKWPSKKLNPSDVKNYDPELRAKYDEQMRLANEIKRYPHADPAELAQKLNWKSDPLKNLGVEPLTLIAKAKSEEPSSRMGRLMKVVDQDGRSADKKVGKCERSYGFVVMPKAGIAYCQQVPKASKTLARIKDEKSLTGFKIVRQCPADRPFQNTNWAGPGSGECLALKSP